MYLPIHEISTDPLIVSTILDLGKSDFTQKVVDHYQLQGEKPFFVLMVWHCVPNLGPQTIDKIAQVFGESKEYIVLANTKEDEAYLHRNKINALFCHQNCFLDTSIFDIQIGEKKHDAIYVAQAVQWKRIELANEIEKLALVCYENPNDDQYDAIYANQLKKDSRVLNARNGMFKYFSPTEVAIAINKAKVGLILSEAEGANYATTEYLLCGLPVITTKNKGGRNVFLNNCNSFEANNSSQIKFGFCLLNGCNPFTIRDGALVIINQHREVFNQYMLRKFPNLEINEHGLVGHYTNKLINWIEVV